MGMFNGLVKWPRKRPHDPGGIASTGSQHAPLQPRRSKFLKTVRRPVPASHQHSTSSDQSDHHRSTLALDIASLAAKTFLLASDAPVIGVLKPFAGLADFACQRVQAVRNNRTSMAELEQEAASLAGIVEAVASVGWDLHAAELSRSTQTLDDIAEFLDQKSLAVSKKRKWRLWLSATQDKEQIDIFHRRLSTAMQGLSTVTSLSNAQEMSKLKHDASSGAAEAVQKITINNFLPEFIRIFERSDTFIKVALFS
ncbi:hypothetical protein C8R46DRAFT_1058191 [Mycena filopes]|nr:hypothetical protein C8R46DRAFT_1058191 [Mycena filopes]